MPKRKKFGKKYVPFKQGMEELRKRFGLPPPEKKPKPVKPHKKKPPEKPRLSRSELRDPTRLTLPALRERLNKREIQVTSALIIQNLYNLREISAEQAAALARNFNIKRGSGKNYFEFTKERMTLQELLRAENVHEK